MEAREKYRAHVAKMFELAGYEPGRGEAGREHGLRDRDAPRRGAPRQRRAARSEAPPTTRPPSPTLQKLTPHFDWTRYFDRAGIPPPTSTSTSRSSCRPSRASSPTTPLATGGVPQVARPQRRRADISPTPFVEENFAFYGAVPARREGDEAALEALRRDRPTRSSARRSASATSSATSRPRPRRACRRW